MSCERRRAALALRAVVVSFVVSAWPATARAQACCAAPNLVVPSRLARHESGALGVQARGRGVFGAFAADGNFARTGQGDLEAAQDLFGALRAGGRTQLAVLVPFVQTRRRAGALSETGGGLGDVRALAHVELLRAGERPFVPGLALLLGASLPTGTPADEAGGTLAASATGSGVFEGSAGLELDQRFERAFVTVAAGVGQRAPRAVGGVSQSFGLRVTALASGGYLFANDLALGGFVSGLHQGAARDVTAGATLPGTALALVTAGVAATFPVGDAWRAQGTLSVDCPVSGFGRNQPAGAGLAISALRVWP